MDMLRARRDGSLETYIQWRKDRKASGLAHSNYSHTTPVDLADDLYNDNWVGRVALDLLESFPQGKPWFLQVNYPGPHAPMDITPSMAGLYKGVPFPSPVDNTQLAPAVHHEIRRNYSAMIENIDRWLGRYLGTLDRRGELENTLVIFSSDHGEMLGDHNLWGKRVPYQPSVSVPLVIRGPRVRKGTVVRGPVSTLDLAATFLDYGGAGRMSGMDSRSLRPVLEEGRQAFASHATSAHGAWRLVSDGRYKLISGFDPGNPAEDDDADAVKKQKPPGGISMAAAMPDKRSLVLYDLETDPNERANVAERHPRIVSKLEKLLPEVAS
jgi:arylsulfatase A-like enzyme